MPWVNQDDQFPEHPKVWGLSDAAYRLHSAGIFYCNRHLTDGRIPAAKVRTLVPNFKQKALDELSDRCLWVLSVSGDWLLHDYLDWNKSKVEVEARREAQRKGGKRGAQKRWG